MTHRVEYLITVDQKDQFCKTTAGFNNLLRTIEGVAISNGDLSWSGMKVGYEVQDGEIQKDKQRFFHAKFTLKDDSMLERFEEFLRSVRGVLSKAGGAPPSSFVGWRELKLRSKRISISARNRKYTQKAHHQVHVDQRGFGVDTRGNPRRGSGVS